MLKIRHLTRSPHMISLTLIFLVALALRLYRLDAQSLWLDEGGSWAEVTGRSGKGWLALIGELISPDAGYPLYHLLLKLWVSLAGDSEWALRFPSALAGALGVLALAGSQPRRPSWAIGLLAALSPFALWHAQDAKAYSLLLLAISLLIWALLRLIASPTRRAWRIFLTAAVVSLFVHRLALMGVASALVALALTLPARHWWQRPGLAALALGGSAAGIAGTIRAAAAERAFAARGALPPAEGITLTLMRFMIDRAPGEIDGYLGLPPALWLLPTAALSLWGLALLTRDAARRDPRAVTLLCMLLGPLTLLAALLTLAPIYEPRYAMVAFPAWILVLGYPWVGAGLRPAPTPASTRPAATALWLIVLATQALILLQPGKGLYSGAPLKEQWREAVTSVARRIQPDDLLLIHPSYVAGLYDYYAPRVTPDPLPHPAIFPVFAEGDTCGAVDPAAIRACWQRRYEPFFNQAAQGRKRAILLIAPDHARTVDPPKTRAELIAETPAGQPQPTEADRYGWVGLRFQYPQKTWPCGGTGDSLIGVEIMCQSFPETYSAGGGGAVPQPSTPSGAVFGGQIHLRGFTITPHGGALRPGGALPITLYWEASAAPRQDYRMFLHLCRDCEQPPLANDDRPPLDGYPPAGLTTTWLVGDPLHDERALLLPSDLAPGEYTLLLGVYSGDARLPITGSDQILSANRLVLATVVIGP